MNHRYHHEMHNYTILGIFTQNGIFMPINTLHVSTREVLSIAYLVLKFQHKISKECNDMASRLTEVQALCQHRTSNSSPCLYHSMIQ